MKLSVDPEKIPVDNQGTIWASSVIREYRLIDVDCLYKDKLSGPLQRLENATMLVALFTANICRFVVYKDEGRRLVPCGANICGDFGGSSGNIADGQVNALRQAMETVGAKIETEPEEYPEIESLLAAFAAAMGITNIAISKRCNEANKNLCGKNAARFQ
jgi:hypothetical protein